MSGATIIPSSEVTLITLQNCSANISSLSKIFEKIAALEVNVDMISLSSTQEASTSLSFTITDEDLGGMLQFISELQARHEIKMIVSSGNNKIIVSDQRTKYTPDVAAAVPAAATCVPTDVRIITVSEDEVSLLVTFTGYLETLTAIEQAVRESQDQTDLGEILI